MKKILLIILLLPLFSISQDIPVIYAQGGLSWSEWQEDLKEEDLWINNSRVKKFKIYVDNQPVCYLTLKDKMGGQSFDLPIKAGDEPWLVEWKEIKFEIIEVYKGDKWSDVAITEIHRVQH